MCIRDRHNTRNSENFEFARKAVQLAVDEVFRATQRAKPEMKINDSKVFDFIPYIDNTTENTTPMFQVRSIDGKVCRRTELQNLRCKQQHNDIWSALETLYELNQSTPNNIEMKIETKKDI